MLGDAGELRQERFGRRSPIAFGTLRSNPHAPKGVHQPRCLGGLRACHAYAANGALICDALRVYPRRSAEDWPRRPLAIYVDPARRRVLEHCDEVRTDPLRPERLDSSFARSKKAVPCLLEK
jgi:hypothetical protein